MATNEERVLEFIKHRGTAIVEEVAKLLQVTNRQARDTLERLRKKGVVKKSKIIRTIQRGEVHRHRATLVEYSVFN
jgi:predicted ArsR family transcriptional regulator